MAANEYYNSYTHHQQEPQPYYSAYDTQSTVPPSYHSQAPSRTGSTRPAEISPVSPFEAPFDDHVYPAAAHRQDSSNSLGQQSQSYGQGGGGRNQDGSIPSREDIPLRDHPQTLGGKDTTGDHVYDADSTDHVYDAGESGVPSHLKNNRRNRMSDATSFGKRKKGIAWVTYTFTFVQVVVFIVEIVKNSTLTGSPIEIHPSFNPMIGPSPYVLINMGSRFTPCMHNMTGIPDLNAISWPCPNTTTSSDDCTISELCGFGGVGATPDQWYRFILPMFLHAGIIHIGFNMLLQLTMGREMELLIGPIRYFLVYACSGIFGFVLGGNFAATGISSTGASGALFGLVALTLLDLLYKWNERPSPWKELAFIGLDIVISFVLGLLPGLDNFSHIGGFLMGIVLGISILRSPNSLRMRTGQSDPPYTAVSNNKVKQGDSGVVSFFKNPGGFFKGRKPAWWAWWLVRVAALVFVFIVFILLLNNFYIYRKTCGWCKYLSCINVNNWCSLGNLDLTNTTTSKRSVLDSWEAMAKLYE
ncbi:Rhomboid family protein [Rutstroemia sp. NJR-2017a BVV2]|nr:Rhomboid family protein [Rutstroemia sp. NJR-2017a BVV2]